MKFFCSLFCKWYFISERPDKRKLYKSNNSQKQKNGRSQCQEKKWVLKFFISSTISRHKYEIVLLFENIGNHRNHLEIRKGEKKQISSVLVLRLHSLSEQ